MKNHTPLKAIRQNCIDCSAGSLKDVRDCIITNCPLYPYRMGKNPSRKNIGRVENIKKPITQHEK